MSEAARASAPRPIAPCSQESQILKMAAAVALASPLGARFERSVLRGIYPGRANEVDRCLNSKGVRRHRRHYYDTATMRTTCAATVPPQPTPCHSTTHHTLVAEHAPHHTQVTPLTAPSHLHPRTCAPSPGAGM